MNKAHRALTLTGLAAVSLVALLTIWVLDREPPFVLVKYIVPQPVKAGEQIVFVLPANRDVSRECDVHFTRYLLDGANIRYDYTSSGPPDGRDTRVQMMSAEGLSDMNARMGPWLRVAVVIPAGATPGKATLGTELEYQCNPLHVWWPIKVSLSFPFEILPKE